MYQNSLIITHHQRTKKYVNICLSQVPLMVVRSDIGTLLQIPNQTTGNDLQKGFVTKMKDWKVLCTEVVCVRKYFCVRK